MPITDDQSKSIKQQLLKQVESFPEEKREEIKEYILGLNNQQLEEFLIKNKLMKEDGTMDEPVQNKKELPPGTNPDCIYCLLGNKAMNSLSIYEDNDYLGILEIKPLSPGQIVLVPKKHVKETQALKSKAFSVADKIGKHLVKQLSAETFQISSSDELKHAIINIIPVYKGKELDRKRPQANQKELQDLANKIGQMKASDKKPRTKKEKVEKKPEPKKTELVKLSRRIP